MPSPAVSHERHSVFRLSMHMCLWAWCLTNHSWEFHYLQLACID